MQSASDSLPTSTDALSLLVKEQQTKLDQQSQFIEQLLVSCLVNSIKNAIHGFDDLVSGFSPSKWLGLFVMMIKIPSYCFLQCRHGSMRSPA